MDVAVGVAADVGQDILPADHAVGDYEGRQKTFGVLAALFLRYFAEDQDYGDIGVATVLGGAYFSPQERTYFQGMELPAQKARGEDKDLTDQNDVCLPIVLVEATIPFDVLDGGRTDRPCERRVVLSPPPFEGLTRNSLRRKSVRISGCLLYTSPSPRD